MSKLKINYQMKSIDSLLFFLQNAPILSPVPWSHILGQYFPLTLASSYSLQKFTLG